MSVSLRRCCPILCMVLCVIALVPALALAGPKSKKRPPKKRATKTTKPVETAEPPAPTPDPPPPVPAPVVKAAAPAPAPAPTVSGTSPGSGAGGANGASGASGASGTSGASGAGGGAGSPAAPPASADAAPASTAPDVDTLRQEYLSLRDELFKSRARANTVASQLYSTRVQIKLTYTTARYYNPAKASIRLDGATIYENVGGGIAGDDGVRFDGYVAPGRHLVTFHIEATGKDDDSFTSITENQIVVKAVAGKDLLVVAKAHDGGDIAYEWKRTERGSYGLGVDVVVKTVPRADAALAKGGKK